MSSSQEELKITLEHIPKGVKHIEIDLAEENEPQTPTNVGSIVQQPSMKHQQPHSHLPAVPSVQVHLTRSSPDTSSHPSSSSHTRKRLTEFDEHDRELDLLEQPQEDERDNKKRRKVDQSHSEHSHVVGKEDKEKPTSSASIIQLRDTALHRRETSLPETRILELGHIYFFYRPKVDLSSAGSADLLFDEEEQQQQEEIKPAGLGDVQRLYVLLVPSEVDKQHATLAEHPEEDAKKDTPPPYQMKARLLVIGRKALPDPQYVHGHTTRHWGYIDKVVPVEQIEELVKERLAPQTYETLTRGVRTLAGARPCGIGVYTIAQHRSSGHTHLAYVNELPEGSNEVQKAFNIQKEESFIFSVKNPLAQGFGPGSNTTSTTITAAPTSQQEAHIRTQPNLRLPGQNPADSGGPASSGSTSVGPSGSSGGSGGRGGGFTSGGAPSIIQKPRFEEYPSRLQKLFDHRRFLATVPLELIDYEGAEFILGGVSYSVVQDLGKEVGTELEKIEKSELGQRPLEDELKEKLYKELHLSKEANPPNALLTGKWV